MESLLIELSFCVLQNQCQNLHLPTQHRQTITVSLRIRMVISWWNVVEKLQLKLVCVDFINCDFVIRNITFPEHSTSTDLTLVGLQVWRGALLLADYIFHNRKQFNGKNVAELGSGVGLTGIAAAMYSQKVICTGKHFVHQCIACNRTFTLSRYWFGRNSAPNRSKRETKLQTNQ